MISEKVPIRNYIQQNKYETTVQKVEPIQENPDCALVMLLNGKENTVPLRKFVPCLEEHNNVPT